MNTYHFKTYYINFLNTNIYVTADHCHSLFIHWLQFKI